MARAGTGAEPWGRPALASLVAALPKDRLSLSDLPVVTKPELMARFDDWATDRSVTETAVREFVADRAHIGDLFLDKYLVWKSSGSTGEPGIYVQDRAALAVYDALLAVQMQSARVATRYALALGYGILTCENRDQALKRAGAAQVQILALARVVKASEALI